MKSGIYNVSNDVYHHGDDWQGMLSSGMVRAIAKGDRYGWNYLYGDRVVSEAFVTGAAWHDRVLLPDTFNSDYVIAPKCDRRTKIGKAIWAEFQEESAGKTVLTSTQSLLIERMTEAIWDSKDARALLSDGVAEESIVWGDDVPKKCRPDWRNTRMNLLVDIKSCQSADMESCKRAILKWQYHWQAWWYLQGVQSVVSDAYQRFVFIFVEKSEPYTVQSIVLHNDWVDLAGDAIKAAQIESRFQKMMNADEKPGQPEIIEIAPPAWMYKQ